jgi:hypothetical protein
LRGTRRTIVTRRARRTLPVRPALIAFAAAGSLAPWRAFQSPDTVGRTGTFHTVSVSRRAEGTALFEPHSNPRAARRIGPTALDKLRKFSELAAVEHVVAVDIEPREQRGNIALRRTGRTNRSTRPSAGADATNDSTFPPYTQPALDANRLAVAPLFRETTCTLGRAIARWAAPNGGSTVGFGPAITVRLAVSFRTALCIRSSLAIGAAFVGTALVIGISPTGTITALGILVAVTSLAQRLTESFAHLVSDLCNFLLTQLAITILIECTQEAFAHGRTRLVTLFIIALLRQHRRDHEGHRHQ